MHLKRNDIGRLCRGVYTIYTGQRIPIAAAGLSFFLTLTIYPLLICLQTMLGSRFPTTEELRGVLGILLPEDTVSTILEYLRYVAVNRSETMLAMALTLVATSSAAAFRILNRVIGDMRGVRRVPGLASFAISRIGRAVMFSFALVFTVLL